MSSDVELLSEEAAICSGTKVKELSIDLWNADVSFDNGVRFGLEFSIFWPPTLASSL